MPNVTLNIGTFELWKMRLSRQGYGDIDLINNLDVKRFMDLIHYENYLTKYENVLKELNKDN